MLQGDVNVINKLLQDGDDPNVKDYAGWTPLVRNPDCMAGNMMGLKFN